MRLFQRLNVRNQYWIAALRTNLLLSRPDSPLSDKASKFRTNPLSPLGERGDIAAFGLSTAFRSFLSRKDAKTRRRHYVTADRFGCLIGWQLREFIRASLFSPSLCAFASLRDISLSPLGELRSLMALAIRRSGEGELAHEPHRGAPHQLRLGLRPRLRILSPKGEREPTQPTGNYPRMPESSASWAGSG
jgi:hypothetical protein